MKTTRTLPGIAAIVLLPLLLVPSAQAGTVHGSVKLPEGARSTRLYQGYWRLENGNVPVQTVGGAKAETVVVLDNLKGAHAPRHHGPRLGRRDQEHGQADARAVDAPEQRDHAHRTARSGIDAPREVQQLSLIHI